MKSFFVIFAIIFAIVFFYLPQVHALQSDQAVSSAPSLSLSQLDTSKTLEIKDKGKESEGWHNSWYLIWGLGNLFPQLNDSERQINNQINTPMNVIFPRWKKPDTFKDWRDSCMLWDTYVGAARDINEKWTVWATVGGVTADIRNKHHYYVLLPARTNVNFSRSIGAINLAVDYYPWGKPNKSEYAGCGNALTRTFCATRPFAELNACYAHLTAYGSGKITMPIIGPIYKKAAYQDYNLFYLSPRLGVEIPFNKKNSITLSAGYNFFFDYANEYNGATYVIMHHYKF